MAPRKLQIVCAASLALLALTLVVWVRSYDAFFVRAYEGNLVLIYAGGDLGVHPRMAEQPGQRSRFVPYMLSSLAVTAPGWVQQDERLLGVRWVRVADTRALFVPFAYVALVPLALSAAAGWRLRRQSRRRRLGLCARCGYDLRYPSGACPECGEANRQPATEAAASESDRAEVRAGGGDAGTDRRVRERDDALA